MLITHSLGVNGSKSVRHSRTTFANLQFLFLYFQKDDHNIPPSRVSCLFGQWCVNHQYQPSWILPCGLLCFRDATFYFCLSWVDWNTPWTLWIHCRRCRRRILLVGGRWLPGDPGWLLHNYTTTTLGKETKYTASIDCNVHTGKCVYPCVSEVLCTARNEIGAR